MTEATRRLNQLEIGLENIEDPYVREALENLVEFNRSLMGSGVQTKGNLVGKDFKLSNGISTGDGVISAKALNLSEGGQFRSILYKGELAASGTVELPVPSGIIMGYCGMGEYTVAGEDVYLEFFSDLVANTIQALSSNGTTLSVGNNDATNANKYRVIIFYTEDDQ